MSTEWKYFNSATSSSDSDPVESARRRDLEDRELRNRMRREQLSSPRGIGDGGRGVLPTSSAAAVAPLYPPRQQQPPRSPTLHRLPSLPVVRERNHSAGGEYAEDDYYHGYRRGSVTTPSSPRARAAPSTPSAPAVPVHVPVLEIGTGPIVATIQMRQSSAAGMRDAIAQWAQILSVLDAAAPR